MRELSIAEGRITDDHSSEYKAVISSARWKKLRSERLRKAMWRCERCGHCPFAGAQKLELHHKTYERLGRELPEDLELLCPNCHSLADNEREQHIIAISESRLYEARLNGWASKRYGEDWEEQYEVEEIEERFDHWLEQRGEYA